RGVLHTRGRAREYYLVPGRAIPNPGIARARPPAKEQNVATVERHRVGSATGLAGTANLNPAAIPLPGASGQYSYRRFTTEQNGSCARAVERHGVTRAARWSPSRSLNPVRAIPLPRVAEG